MEQLVRNNSADILAMKSQAVTEIESVQELLKAKNIQCKPYSIDALAKTKTFDQAELLNKVTANFSILKELLSETEAEIKDNGNLEIVWAKRALNRFGMRVDENFWSLVKPDESIEIYGADMIQKYRSMNFYDLTGYSLLDLVVNEWWVLWERPTTTLNELLEKAKEILEGKSILVEAPAKNHLVKEILNTGTTEPFHPRLLAVEFKYAIPTYKSVGKEVNGLVITSTCKPVGDAADLVGFI